MAISEQSHLKKTSNSLSNDIILYPIAKTSNDKLLNTEETVSLIKETVIPWSNIEDKPTSLSGYGIINAYTKTEVDNRIASAVTGSTVDLTGYLTKDKADNAYLGKHDIANSANKLNTNAGSTIQPVYFENGIPVETAYTLETSVPSGAKFTDTVYTHPSTHAASMITGLADVAISGAYSDLTGTPSALPADGGDADTVSGFTVGTNVPANAKFTDTTYNAASASAAGLMSAEDKAKLDSIAEGANNYTYTLPNATSSTLGGVKVGTNISVSSGTISVANGSTSAKGVVQLTNSTSSTSTTTAATPSSVKAAYDLADSKQSPATTLAGYGITDAYTKTQVDSAIGIKANTADLATVATSGAYADLSGTPTSLKNPNSLTLQNSAGTSLGSYNGSEAKTIKLTASTVGLGNVTNESKATMFTSAALTGTPTAPTASAATNSTQIATTAFVNTVVNNKIAAADAMIYKGTIGTGGTVTSLPNTHSTGWTYKVITAGTYAGVACNIGDMIICLTDGTAANNAHWTVIEGNIDGAVTGPASAVNARVAVFDGTTGKIIKDSGYTIETSVPSGAKFTDTTYGAATTSAAGLLSAADKTKLDSISAGANAYTHPSYTARTGKPTANQTPAFGGTATVSQITSDALGHVTGVTDRTIKIPSTLSNGTGTAGLIKTTSTVTSNSGYTPCPVISGVPYYKDTDTTYTLGSFGISATATELNYCDGVTSNIQTQLNSKLATSGTATKATADASGNVITDTYETKANAITGLSVSGKVVTYTKGDGSTGTITTQDSNTTYSKMSASEATTGTATTARSITAKVLHDKITEVVDENAYTHPSYTAKSSGLYKVTIDATGHVSATAAVAKSDITALGIPAQDTTYTLPAATSSALGGVKIGSNITNSSGTISLTKSNVTSALGYTPPTKDTTYSTATSTTAGIVKLYNELGENTDGTMTQVAIYSALNQINEIAGETWNEVASLHNNKADKATTLSGYGITNAYTKTEVDAKIPTSLPANGGNADTVSGFTVKTSVPADAKFTDTTYSNATTSKAGLMSAYDKIKLDNIQNTNNSYSVYGNTVDRDSSLPTYGLL